MLPGPLVRVSDLPLFAGEGGGACQIWFSCELASDPNPKVGAIMSGFCQLCGYRRRHSTCLCLDCMERRDRDRHLAVEVTG